MKKRYFIITFVLIFFCLICFNVNSYATDLDQIKDYEVTVDPRMNDGTLDITYKITWKVLDSTSEGPLTWVQIGTPNANFDNPTAISNNIESISQYNGSYVKINFKKAYYAGETITFRYSIHQGSMHKKSFNKCKFAFTPAWFTDIKIDQLTIRWNADQVKKSDSQATDGNYLVWKKANLEKGEKITVNVTYDKSAFATLSKATLSSNTGSYSSGNTSNNTSNNASTNFYNIMMFLFIIIIIASAMFGGGGGGYYRHRGFYGGYGYHHHRHHGGCVRSSCACASSCASSCACACAGSGRAGCSKKDLYGTKVNLKKFREL